MPCSIGRIGLQADFRRNAATTNFVADSKVIRGPNLTLAGDLGRCGAARQTGHSLHVQYRGMIEYPDWDLAAVSNL